MTRTLAFRLVLFASLTGGTASAGTPATPAPKWPEVTTVGTTPVALTAADRTKLAETQQRLAARRPSITLSAPSAKGKSAEVSTRVPARRTGVRTKPGQANPVLKTAPPIPAAQQPSVSKGGRP